MNSVGKSLLLLAACWLGPFVCEAAEQPRVDAWDLVPADAVVVLEFERPARLLESRFLQSVWRSLQQTEGYRRELRNSNPEKLAQAARFLEQSLSTDWKSALDQLTSGGVLLAVRRPADHAEPDVLVLVETDRSETLNRFVTAIHSELDRQRPDQQQVVHDTYRDQPCHRAGDAHYTLFDARLAATNSRAMLERCIDSVLESADSRGPSGSSGIAARRIRQKPAGTLASARGYLAMESLRREPGISEALATPARDASLPFLLGGYLDLIRRAGLATAILDIDGDGVTATLSFDVGHANRPPEWSGFFAGGIVIGPLPLLHPQGRIYAASWYRDYRALWQQRPLLLQPEVVAQLETENDRQRRTAGQFGLVDVIEHLGPHYRIAVTQSVAGSDGRNWPGAGFTVDLRNADQFTDRILGPLTRMLPVAAAAVGGELTTTRQGPANLTTFRFRETETSVVPEPFRSILNPCFAVGHGHLLVATSDKLALELLDELAAPVTSETTHDGVTESQELSFSALGTFLAQFRHEIESNTANRQALAPEVARREVDLLLQLCSDLGTATSVTRLLENRFDYELRIGRALVNP